MGLNLNSGFTKAFLEKLFGVQPGGLPQLGIKKETNEKGNLVEYHGVVAAHNIPASFINLPSTSSIPSNIRTFKIDSIDCPLLEIGVNINFFIKPTFTPPFRFDNEACHIEIKYALPTDSTYRFVLNIHLAHDINITDVNDIVIQLQQKIQQTLNDQDVKKECHIARSVSLFNFEHYHYKIADSSVGYYGALTGFIANQNIQRLDKQLAQEQATRATAEKKLSDAQQEIEDLKSKITVLEKKLSITSASAEKVPALEEQLKNEREARETLQQQFSGLQLRVDTLANSSAFFRRSLQTNPPATTTPAPTSGVTEPKPK